MIKPPPYDGAYIRLIENGKKWIFTSCTLTPGFAWRNFRKWESFSFGANHIFSERCAKCEMISKYLLSVIVPTNTFAPWKITKCYDFLIMYTFLWSKKKNGREKELGWKNHWHKIENSISTLSQIKRRSTQLNNSFKRNNKKEKKCRRFLTPNFNFHSVSCDVLNRWLGMNISVCALFFFPSSLWSDLHLLCACRTSVNANIMMMEYAFILFVCIEWNKRSLKATQSFEFVWIISRFWCFDMLIWLQFRCCESEWVCVCYLR